MHASERPSAGTERKAALHQSGIEPTSLKLIPAPSAGKKTAFVNVRLQMDFQDTWQCGFMKRHL
jgi:hypothetical protein